MRDPHSGRNRSRRTSRAVLGLSALLLGVSACGGGSDSGDGASSISEADLMAITKVANSVVTTNDATSKKTCATLLTAQYVTTVFGDQKTCATPSENAAEDIATGAMVTEISVDGDVATAVVTEQGGAAAGASGRWSFAREGSVWRVSEWSTAYLRSQFETTFGPNYRSDGSDDPLADPELRGCLSDAVQAKDDATFLAFSYEVFRQSSAGEKQFADLFLTCADEPAAGGISQLRKLFEDQIRASLGSEMPGPVQECLIRELRKGIPDSAIRALTESGGEFPPETTKLVEKTTLDCLEKTPT